MSKVNEIYEGWKNLLLKKLDKLPKELGELYSSRIHVCNECTMRYKNFCNPNKKEPHVITGIPTRGCGCNLSAKVLSKESKCPLGKW